MYATSEEKPFWTLKAARYRTANTEGILLKAGWVEGKGVGGNSSSNNEVSQSEHRTYGVQVIYLFILSFKIIPACREKETLCFNFHLTTESLFLEYSQEQVCRCGN